MYDSQFLENFGKTAMLFLHFLMVASALFSFPRSNEFFHSLEDFVHPSHVFIDEMMRMNFEEPMISLVLFCSPMASFDSLG